MKMQHCHLVTMEYVAVTWAVWNIQHLWYAHKLSCSCHILVDSIEHPSLYFQILVSKNGCGCNPRSPPSSWQHSGGSGSTITFKGRSSLDATKTFTKQDLHCCSILFIAHPPTKEVTDSLQLFSLSLFSLLIPSCFGNTTVGFLPDVIPSPHY